MVTGIKIAIKRLLNLFISYLSIQNRKWANRIVENIVNAENLETN